MRDLEDHYSGSSREGKDGSDGGAWKGGGKKGIPALRGSKEQVGTMRGFGTLTLLKEAPGRDI